MAFAHSYCSSAGIPPFQNLLFSNTDNAPDDASPKPRTPKGHCRGEYIYRNDLNVKFWQHVAEKSDLESHSLFLNIKLWDSICGGIVSIGVMCGGKQFNDILRCLVVDHHVGRCKMWKT